MEEYLKKVLEQGTYKDLVQTREQIHSCFEKVRGHAGRREEEEKKLGIVWSPSGLTGCGCPDAIPICLLHVMLVPRGMFDDDACPEAIPMPAHATSYRCAASCCATRART